MWNLRVSEFAVETQSFFRQAIRSKQLDADSVASQMLETFKFVLRPDGIVFDEGDGLFDFELAFEMFNGSAEIKVSSEKITARFTDARNLQALKLIGESINSIYQVFSALPIQVSQVTGSSQCVFEEGEAYAAFMKPFVKPELGISAGGIVLFAEGKFFQGEIRLSVEKSLSQKEGIFLSWQVGTEQALNSDLMSAMLKRFEELQKGANLNLRLSE
jgi:hypothetical protein